ncbi:chloroplast photosystem II 10 kDa protein [Pseudoscourfieldia marina]
MVALTSSFTGARVNATSYTASRVRAAPLKVVANVKKGENKAKKGGSPNTGTSNIMDKKGWVDPQGRKGKGYGVYRYDKKYGANVDGYSPIYTPTEWSETGDTYAGGPQALLVWAGLLGTGLLAGVIAIVSTSAIGS